MVTRLVKFPGCCQYLKVPAGQLSRLITHGKVLKKVVVLDGQEKCGEMAILSFNVKYVLFSAI